MNRFESIDEKPAEEDAEDDDLANKKESQEVSAFDSTPFYLNQPL